MKNKRICSFLILLTVCIVTAFSFLKSSAVSSQKNEIKTNPDTEYKITYELNGGKWVDETGNDLPIFIKFTVKQEIHIPNPTKDGAEFLGWTINDNTNVAPIKNYVIPKGTIGDIKLTANWKSRSILVDGLTFRNAIAIIGKENITKIVFDYGKPNKNGTSLSENDEIKAHLEGDTIYVLSESEIFANESCRNMFEYHPTLKTIEFNNFNTSQVIDMASMFCESRNLNQLLGTEKWNVEKVKYMNNMFDGCSSLTSLDLSNWDTSNVTHMNRMFDGCYELTNIDISNWNTSNLINMNEMFYDCQSLINIQGLDTLDTTNVKKFMNTFDNCTKLSGSITIKCKNTFEDIDGVIEMYPQIYATFSRTSTNQNAKFIVKYIDDETKGIAKQMVDTKSPNSNVYLDGTQPAILMDGRTFNSTILGMSGFSNVEEIRFVKGTPNPNGIDVSEAQDGSIKAHIEGNVLKVACEGEIFANKNCANMFKEFGYYFGVNKLLNKIIFNNFNTTQVTDMSSMFFGCNSLTSIDVSNFDTSQVTNMNGMFSDCSSLPSIDVSNFNTSKVTDMCYMFRRLRLTTLNLSNFNTRNVTMMNSMFDNCSKLTTLDLSKWDTSQVTNMYGMFSDCSSLTSLDVSNFDTSQVTDMRYMFRRCSKLSGEITIMNPNISDYSDMFLDCSTDPSAKFIVKYVDEATKEIARRMVDTKTRDDNVFLYEVSTLVNGKLFNDSIKTLRGFEDVTEIVFDQGVYNGSDIVDVSEAQDESIKAFILGNSLFIASENEIVANPDSSYMFNNLKNITNIDFSFNFNTDNVTNMRGMFEGSSKLIEIVGLEKWDTSQVTNMCAMFNGCISLTSLDVSDFNTSKVTDMSIMFFNCKSLTSLDLSKWDTSQVTDMSDMFSGCSSLTSEITISNPNITIKYRSMFLGCSTNTGSKFIVKYTNNETKEVAKQMINTKSYNSNVFLYEPPKPSILTNNFYDWLFEDVTEIRFIYGTPNPNGEDVSEAQDGSIMASIEGTVLTVACEGEIIANSNCSNLFNTNQVDRNLLKKIVFENFNTSQVTDMRGMFEGSSNLIEIVGIDKWNTSQVTDTGDMFRNCSSITNLNLSKWNTTMVDYMSGMFYNCQSLTEIVGLEKLDLGNVISIDELFRECNNLSGEITISKPNISYWNEMFYNCSTEPNTKFVVKYIDDTTKKIAQNLVATKNSGTTVGNVLLYEETTINDIPSNEEPSIPDTVVLTIKDGNTVTTKEILAGEIGSINVPSKEGMVFSGYFYDAEFTNPVSEKDVIAEDTTIYIKWEEVPQVDEIPQEENKDENLEVA